MGRTVATLELAMFANAVEAAAAAGKPRLGSSRAASAAIGPGDALVPSASLAIPNVGISALGAVLASLRTASVATAAIPSAGPSTQVAEAPAVVPTRLLVVAVRLDSVVSFLRGRKNSPSKKI